MFDSLSSLGTTKKELKFKALQKHYSAFIPFIVPNVHPEIWCCGCFSASEGPSSSCCTLLWVRTHRVTIVGAVISVIAQKAVISPPLSAVMLLAEHEAAAALCDICVISGCLCADKQHNYTKSIVSCRNGVLTLILEIIDASLFLLF